MRHVIVAMTMLMVALVITFGAASLLQRAATAKGPTDSEPFAVSDEAKPDAPKLAINKERTASQFRERSINTATRVGL
jgi:hypothetical protein